MGTRVKGKRGSSETKRKRIKKEYTGKRRIIHIFNIIYGYTEKNKNKYEMRRQRRSEMREIWNG